MSIDLGLTVPFLYVFRATTTIHRRVATTRKKKWRPSLHKATTVTELADLITLSHHSNTSRPITTCRSIITTASQCRILPSPAVVIRCTTARLPRRNSNILDTLNIQGTKATPIILLRRVRSGKKMARRGEEVGRSKSWNSMIPTHEPYALFLPLFEIHVKP